MTPPADGVNSIIDYYPAVKLSKARILELLQLLDGELAKTGVIGELNRVRGAVM